MLFAFLLVSFIPDGSKRSHWYIVCRQSEDRIGKDRQSEDRQSKDRIGKDRIGKDRIGEDRLPLLPIVCSLII